MPHFIAEDRSVTGKRSDGMRCKTGRGRLFRAGNLVFIEEKADKVPDFAESILEFAIQRLGKHVFRPDRFAAGNSGMRTSAACEQQDTTGQCDQEMRRRLDLLFVAAHG